MKQRQTAITASYLLLKKENKILLIRRFNTGYKDGKYTFPSGHVDEGEFADKAIIREAKEEIGINIKKEDIKMVHVLHRIKPDGKVRVDFFFEAKTWEGEPKNMEPHKCDDINWFEINSLPKNTIEYIMQVLDMIKQGKKFSSF